MYTYIYIYIYIRIYIYIYNMLLLLGIRSLCGNRNSRSVDASYLICRSVDYRQSFLICCFLTRSSPCVEIVIVMVGIVIVMVGV